MIELLRVSRVVEATINSERDAGSSNKSQFIKALAEIMKTPVLDAEGNLIRLQLHKGKVPYYLEEKYGK
jgi:hypothetical protein